jgi:hypothetical protein
MAIMGLPTRLGIAVRDLHRGLFVLAQHHVGIIAAVIDDRIVQSAVARAGLSAA